ncbi:DoxX family membrane protein [Streptomyces xinghaiensis]|uniref:DoxX family membrane protein n=1 Tax=Streptomyces xinghaiensis TaxID=1038928 RepID=UPI00341C898C
MAKVPSDPAQVVVNQASFRVQLAAPPTRLRVPVPARFTRVTPTPAAGPVPAAGHRAPAVWSGRTAEAAQRPGALPPRAGRPPAAGLGGPGATGDHAGGAPTRLLDIAGYDPGDRGGPGDPRRGPGGRLPGPGDRSGPEGPSGPDDTTQLIPRARPEEDTQPQPAVHEPGAPRPPGGLPGGAEPARGAFDTAPQPPPPPYLPYGHRPRRGADEPYDQGGPYDPYDQGGPGGPGGPGGSSAPDDPGDRDTLTYESTDPYGTDPYGEDTDPYGTAGPYEDGAPGEEEQRDGNRPGADAVRHAYYPGRRMNLGVVLLPLRLLLGFISVYAGMGKLCDPVYFDGSERGSLVNWLRELEPSGVAAPLHDFALAHPVGSGLTVAFLQIVVGVLTVCGLWQRFAASVGALLSAALLLTVSWRGAVGYEAPDMLYLAAWSPLIIAGAPVYSLDGRLASEAWRRLGPRVDVRELRRRVLRRGAVMAAVVVGGSLITGAVLGGAVRSTDLTTVPSGPGETPRNHLPGSPLPDRSGEESRAGDGAAEGPGARESDRSTDPATSPSAPESADAAESGSDEAQPTQGAAEDGQQAPPEPTFAPEPPAAGTTGPSSTGSDGGAPYSGSTGGESAGGSGGGAGGGAGGGSTGGGGSDGGSSGGGGRGALGGLLG